MRHDPDRLTFEIHDRDGMARRGTLQTPHGPVETPAFIPLATKGSVRGMSSREVAGFGYEMVLGNTYHLLVAPGPERMIEAGGLHKFMGWDRAIITDSGGFQVFSLAHGGVAEEIKGTGRKMQGLAKTLGIEEEGVRFRSYKDGSELMLSPEASMSVQAALASDIALVFDECTPFHADREYTARSTERTHRWLDRSLKWHQDNAPAGQAVFGIIQGGTYEDLRRESCQYVGEAEVDGIAIGGTLGRDKDEMAEVLGFTVPALPVEAPKHLLGIGEVDDLMHGIALGLDVFDCAVPTRLARHGMALAPDPEKRFRIDMRKGGMAGDHRPMVEGCSCVSCEDYDRDYINYISRSEELTAVRLLVEHNLTYMERLMAGARAAIADGRFSEYSARILVGTAPWDAA
ncbi:MAG TPA: tRNA guanosine(34) transglycosylase Tgt [Solirubrobacterales bacterium]|nr:tRNA guanosine(34) transglycosylase Tgt [Solirubrobacterales bacterium]